MPKKFTPSGSNSSRSTPVSTPVRNSPIPRPMNSPQQSGSSQNQQLTHEMIAKRAYEISRSNNAGSQMDNWLRAERELRGGR